MLLEGFAGVVGDGLAFACGGLFGGVAEVLGDADGDPGGVGVSAGEGAAAAADFGGDVVGGSSGVLLVDAPALAVADVVGGQVDVGADQVGGPVARWACGGPPGD